MEKAKKVLKNRRVLVAGIALIVAVAVHLGIVAADESTTLEQNLTTIIDILSMP